MKGNNESNDDRGDSILVRAVKSSIIDVLAHSSLTTPRVPISRSLKRWMVPTRPKDHDSR